MLCPRCDSLVVVQHPSSSLLDRLLSWVSIYPFQCQSCTHRFRARQREARSFPSSVEHRKVYRTPVHIPISFKWGEGTGEGMVTDISMGGCAIESKRRLEPGLILRLQLPVGTDEESDITMQQIASVRTVHGDRIGVKFLAFTPQEQLQLTQTVTRTIRKFAKK